MLEASLIESRKRVKTRKPVTVVLSVIAHVVTVGALVLIPLLQTQALTIPPVDVSMFFPKMIEKPASVPVFTDRIQTRQTRPSEGAVALSMPAAIPLTIVRAVEGPNDADLPLLPAGTGHGTAPILNTLGSNPPEISQPVAPPAVLPPPPPPPIGKTAPIRQHSSVQTANLIYQVKPVYPPIARQTRIQGVVVLEAVIDKEGSIQSLRVISGHPLLTQAALDAVKQWRYRPTLLNGDPIEVITTITVTFSFQ